MQAQTLRVAVTQLAQVFADQVFEALRSMSLDEILEVSHGPLGTPKGRAADLPARSPRLTPRTASRRSPVEHPSADNSNGRRSGEDVDAAVDRIVGLLRAHKDGLRAEQIREQLGIDRRELTKPIGVALDQKRIVKQGEKRATTYYAR